MIIDGQPQPELQIHRTSDHGVDKFVHQDLLPWSAPELAPITVVIPSIPVRVHQLNRALKSIERQTVQPERVIVQVDGAGEGAPMTRNRGLQKVQGSEAVAFLDDDDYFKRHHLAVCWEAMQTERADYVYPWFTIAGPSIDPFQHLDWWKRPWRDDRPHQTTIVTLVRRELAQVVGFRPTDHEKYPQTTPEGYIFGEDYQFTLECLEKGAKIHHVPRETWFWVVTGWNTSGRPDKWRAVEAETESSTTTSLVPGLQQTGSHS